MASTADCHYTRGRLPDTHGGRMTRDTTFKEFVEEQGLDFTRLLYDSNEYKELARQFNEAKLELIQENPAAGECQGGEESEKA